MSYIAFDLDALNVARDVGAACGIAEERVTHGLLRMWAWCFREKVDTIQAIQVQGFFGAPAAPALVAFGFLESIGTDFRVRGATRYLRIREARSRGGQAAKKHLIPGGPRPRPQPRPQPRPPLGSSRGPAEVEPSSTLGSTSALTPSTEHRTPNTTKRTAPAAQTPRESDSLCEDFEAAIGEKYAWQGVKDGTAFARLRKEFSLEEIRERWRKGLQASGWQQVRTVAQLLNKWNDLAGDLPDKTKPDWLTKRNGEQNERHVEGEVRL